ncbi:MAG: hypothetical protein H6728_16455 [Myxococcales bacterium]|nr:hypothetical protein [Myxococcales bacterium]
MKAMRSLFLLSVLFGFSVFSIQCGTPTEAFPCKKANNGWERCYEGKIQYCHAESDTDGHAHFGQDCAAQGLVCEVVGTNDAACVDKTKSCQGSEAKCESNTAYNCVNGSFALEPCGTAKTCEVESGKAHCHSNVEECGGHGHIHDGETQCECETGYKLDPSDATKCIAE